MCNFCCILVFDLVVLLFWAIALVVVCCFRLLDVLVVLDLFGCCCECVLLGMIRWFVVWLVWCLCSFEVRVL